MQLEKLRHLDRDWEATIPDAPGVSILVRFRSGDVRDTKTYEARIDREELEDDERERMLALRRGLESALVLDVLAAHRAGLTAEEVGRKIGMPGDAAEARLELLDEVQPLVRTRGPRRYRWLDGGRP
jgi:hypothetical protein